MTAIQVVETITKVHKYYNYPKPPIKEGTASRIVRAIKNGSCKPETQKKFFARFGYYVATEADYQFDELLIQIKPKL